jgi:integrase
MAKAKKLPSGSWRVQVFSHRDADGKVHRESITAPTKAEAEMLAAEFKATKKRQARHDLTVGEAIAGYITAKEGVLSPSTIREYRRMQNCDYGGINNKRIRNITKEDVQLFVSDMASKVSPKTVQNRYGLLRASIALYRPDINYRITLPKKSVKYRVAPSDDAVRAILAEAQPLTKKCIMLAMCGLRRGEIAALKYEDITDGVAHIHADVVQDKDNKWIYKDIPKTEGSDRFIRLPNAVLNLIGQGEGFIIPLTPNKISWRFDYVADKLGFDIHLHDLRHYYASIGAVLGVPDIYMAEMGGWRHDSRVMKEVYQNNIQSMGDYYADRMNSHLDKIIEGA